MIIIISVFYPLVLSDVKQLDRWSTVCPRSSDPFYVVTYYNKMGHYFLDI